MTEIKENAKSGVFLVLPSLIITTRNETGLCKYIILEPHLGKYQMEKNGVLKETLDDTFGYHIVRIKNKIYLLCESTHTTVDKQVLVNLETDTIVSTVSGNHIWPCHPVSWPVIGRDNQTLVLEDDLQMHSYDIHIPEGLMITYNGVVRNYIDGYITDIDGSYLYHNIEGIYKQAYIHNTKSELIMTLDYSPWYNFRHYIINDQYIVIEINKCYKLIYLNSINTNSLYGPTNILHYKPGTNDNNQVQIINGNFPVGDNICKKLLYLISNVHSRNKIIGDGTTKMDEIESEYIIKIFLVKDDHISNPAKIDDFGEVIFELVLAIPDFNLNKSYDSDKIYVNTINEDPFRTSEKYQLSQFLYGCLDKSISLAITNIITDYCVFLEYYEREIFMDYIRSQMTKKNSQ